MQSLWTLHRPCTACHSLCGQTKGPPMDPNWAYCIKSITSNFTARSCSLGCPLSAMGRLMPAMNKSKELFEQDICRICVSNHDKKYKQIINIRCCQYVYIIWPLTLGPGRKPWGGIPPFLFGPLTPVGPCWEYYAITSIGLGWDYW